MFDRAVAGGLWAVSCLLVLVVAVVLVVLMVLVVVLVALVVKVVVVLCHCLGICAVIVCLFILEFHPGPCPHATDTVINVFSYPDEGRHSEYSARMLAYTHAPSPTPTPRRLEDPDATAFDLLPTPSMECKLLAACVKFLEPFLQFDVVDRKCSDPFHSCSHCLQVSRTHASSFTLWFESAFPQRDP